jgi:hypothetical protein
MTVGKSPPSGALFRSTRRLCEPRLGAASIYRLLAEQGDRLFAEEAFADLFDDVGRRSVPRRIVATVMVLQRFEGVSDREAVDRFAFDLRWKYAAGVDLDYASFVHTVLVDMRARLRESQRPNRIVEAAVEMAKAAGLVGRTRVLDSTALYDAMATQDTVTMVRSAIRRLLQTVDDALGAVLRAALKRDDDYGSAGKPACDWDDAAAREALVDALARDGYALLVLLDGRELSEPVQQAAALLATVLGQDLEKRDDGVFRIARRVAADRVISTVDPDARHGHKTESRRFDGYKRHIAVDPDSEIITATEVTAGNAGDATVAEALPKDVLPPATDTADVAPNKAPQAQWVERAEVYGDASYGTAELVERVQAAGIEANLKVQPPSPPRTGMFSQDDFAVDAQTGTVTCPRGVLIVLRSAADGSQMGAFGEHCDGCPMRPPMHRVQRRPQCATSPQARGARSRTQATARSGLARSLSRNATEGRTQDRTLDAAQARRPCVLACEDACESATTLPC